MIRAAHFAHSISPPDADPPSSSSQPITFRVPSSNADISRLESTTPGLQLGVARWAAQRVRDTHPLPAHHGTEDEDTTLSLQCKPRIRNKPFRPCTACRIRAESVRERQKRERSRNVSSCKTAGDVIYDCASVDKDKVWRCRCGNGTSAFSTGDADGGVSDGRRSALSTCQQLTRCHLVLAYRSRKNRTDHYTRRCLCYSATPCFHCHGVRPPQSYLASITRR